MKVPEYKKKIENIICKLGVPVQVLKFLRYLCIIVWVQKRANLSLTIIKTIQQYTRSISTLSSRQLKNNIICRFSFQRDMDLSGNQD